MSHRQVKITLVLMTTFLVIVGMFRVANGQCVNGRCPPQQAQPWQSTQPWQSIQAPRAVAQTPHPAICKVLSDRNVTIDGRQAVETSTGSGVLVWKGPDKAVVLTVEHLFDPWPSKVTCVFPNGERHQAERVQVRAAPDLGMITITSPSAEPIEVYTGTPVVGDQVTVCGYDGPTGQYRTKKGTVRGYGSHDGQSAENDLIVSGRATEGQSGGAMLNTSGHLVGIIWGSDNYDSRGSFNGVLCQFLGEGKFIVPWNANLAGDKYKADAQVQAAQIHAQSQAQAQRAPLVAVAPVTGVGGGVDGQARQIGQNNAFQIDAINSRLVQIEQTMGVHVGELSDGIAAVSSRVDEQKESLVERVKGITKTAVFSVLQPWGIGGLVAGTLGFFFLRKYAMDVAKLIDKGTDKIPGSLDDKVIDSVAYKLASVISGQPIPPHANTPGVDPWGRPYQHQQAQQQQDPVPPPPPAQQPAAAPAKPV